MARMPARPKVATAPALCTGEPELMFPLEESIRPGQGYTAGERAALAGCRRCPLLGRCRDEVLAMALPYGVAGGLTAAQRREVRAQRAHPGRRGAAA